MHVRVIQDEPANVFDDGRHVRALRREELSKVTAHDEQGRVLNHGEFAALTEGKQSSAQEFQRADLLHCDDSFKTEPLGKTEPSGKSRTAPSGESGNVELERKPHCKEPNSSVTGFCLTAYVTGFGGQRPRSVASMGNRTQSAATRHRSVELQVATESLNRIIPKQVFSQLVHTPPGLDRRPTSKPTQASYAQASQHKYKQANTSKLSQASQHKQANTSKLCTFQKQHKEARVRLSANHN